MRGNTELMNFRIKNDLKREFQIICDDQNVSMSGRINDFIREFVGENRKQMDMEKVMSEMNWEVGRKKWKNVFGDFRDELGW